MTDGAGVGIGQLEAAIVAGHLPGALVQSHGDRAVGAFVGASAGHTLNHGGVAASIVEHDGLPAPGESLVHCSLDLWREQGASRARWNVYLGEVHQLDFWNRAGSGSFGEPEQFVAAGHGVVVALESGRGRRENHWAIAHFSQDYGEVS